MTQNNIPKEFTGATVWHSHGITGEGVFVAVVDSGVHRHEDLTVLDGYAVEPNEVATVDVNPFGHGTHVAGIAAGAVYGVAPGAVILPVKITKGDGNWSSVNNIKKALEWILAWHKATPTKRVVVNISFAGTSSRDLVDIIKELAAEGIPVVVGACNSGQEQNPLAEYDTPIVVANAQNETEMNDTSTCWGDLTDCCVIGTNVISCDNADTGYVVQSGTSMAAPAVAGMLALILSRWPDMTEQEAYDYLMQHATPAEVKCPSGMHTIQRVELPDDFEAKDEETDEEEVDEIYKYEKMQIDGISEGNMLIARESPDTSSAKTANFKNGDSVTVLAEEGDRVLVTDGACGWVNAKYVAQPDDGDSDDGGDSDSDDDTKEDDMAAKVSIAKMLAYYKPHTVVTNSKAPTPPPDDQWGYVMGGDGRVATASYLVQRAKSSYPSSWENYVTRTTKWLGRPVYDCNALAEAFYKSETGTDINTKARLNYANWCGVKSPIEPDSKLTGMPQQPGVAVFSGDSASSITHVGFLLEKYGDSDLEWYVLEARGADYGLVITKLAERSWRWWGVMDKYFEYDAEIDTPAPEPTTEPYYATCGGNSVNVRTGRGTSYDSLGKLDKGEKMLALPEIDGWCEIAANIDGTLQTGYMSAQYVSGVTADE